MQNTKSRGSLNIICHIGMVILKLKQMQSNEPNKKQCEYTQIQCSALQWSSTNLLKQSSGIMFTLAI